MEAELEDEKKQRVTASSGKKKLENEIQDLAAQVESAAKGKEDAVRQLRKLQAQMKELVHDLDESQHAREELAASTKESERKYKSMEADHMQLQEVGFGNCWSSFLESFSFLHSFFSFSFFLLLNFCA